MQISVSKDSDRTRNGQNTPPPPPPKILGTIGHPRYNEFSVLMNFVPTGFSCIESTCFSDMRGVTRPPLPQTIPNILHNEISLGFPPC